MSQKYPTDVHLFKRVFYWFAQAEESGERRAYGSALAA